MPEEINRILTDHISNYLFCPSNVAVNNLDYTKIVLLRYELSSFFQQKKFNEVQINLIKNGYYLGTIHRAENTDDPDKIITIFEAFSKLNFPVVIPLHPRTKKLLDSMSFISTNIYIIEPVGYLEMLFLQKFSNGVITDSGGVQKEAYILKKPCITLREQTEWIETLEFGWNKLSRISVDDILNNVEQMNNVSLLNYRDLYGDGDTASKIVDIIKKEIKK